MERIGQLAIFIICAQTLLHFRAKESYEKYIKLLVSMMLLILTLEPIMDLFGGKGNEGIFQERIQIYEEELTDVMGSGALSSSQIEEILTGITEQAIKEGEQTGDGENKQNTFGFIESIGEGNGNNGEICIEEIEGMEVRVQYGDDTETP